MLFSWEHLKYQNSHPGAHFGTSLREPWGGCSEPDVSFRARMGNIFMIPTLCPVDNKTKDLQYKIILRFVPTNKLLYNMKKVNSQTCSFCHVETETVEHLFFNCIHMKDIWIYVSHYGQRRLFA